MQRTFYYTMGTLAEDLYRLHYLDPTTGRPELFKIGGLNWLIESFQGWCRESPTRFLNAPLFARKSLEMSKQFALDLASV